MGKAHDEYLRDELHEEIMSFSSGTHLHVVSFVRLNSGLKVHQIILAIWKSNLGCLGKVKFSDICQKKCKVVVNNNLK